MDIILKDPKNQILGESTAKIIIEVASISDRLANFLRDGAITAELPTGVLQLQLVEESGAAWLELIAPNGELFPEEAI
jgi:hypothetical protein